MPVKLEPYSTNTLITVDTENADSRLIRFMDGFNFEESYQDWSSNVSIIQTHLFYSPMYIIKYFLSESISNSYDVFTS